MGDFSATLSRREWDTRKAAEECSELVTVLLQQLNKPHKNLENEVIEEIGDVIFRLDRLKLHYNSDKLTKRILQKTAKEETRNEKSNKARGH